MWFLLHRCECYGRASGVGAVDPAMAGPIISWTNKSDISYLKTSRAFTIRYSDPLRQAKLRWLATL